MTYFACLCRIRHPRGGGRRSRSEGTSRRQSGRHTARVHHARQLRRGGQHGEVGFFEAPRGLRCCLRPDKRALRTVCLSGKRSGSHMDRGGGHHARGHDHPVCRQIGGTAGQGAFSPPSQCEHLAVEDRLQILIDDLLAGCGHFFDTGAHPVRLFHGDDVPHFEKPVPDGVAAGMPA